MNARNAGHDLEPSRRPHWRSQRGSRRARRLGAEHLHIEPLISQVDAALVAADLAGLAEGVGAELFPWPLDGAPAATSRRLLNMLQPPARLLYRALWRPSYARTPRWVTAET